MQISTLKIVNICYSKYQRQSIPGTRSVRAPIQSLGSFLFHSIHTVLRDPTATWLATWTRGFLRELYRDKLTAANVTPPPRTARSMLVTTPIQKPDVCDRWIAARRTQQLQEDDQLAHKEMNNQIIHRYDVVWNSTQCALKTWLINGSPAHMDSDWAQAHTWWWERMLDVTASVIIQRILSRWA